MIIMMRTVLYVRVSVRDTLTCEGGLLAVSAGIDAVEEALDGVGLGDAGLASSTVSSFTCTKAKSDHISQ